MAQFFIITNEVGEVITCAMSLDEARAVAEIDYKLDAYSVQRVTVPVTVDSIRRLLGECGGYATDTRTVYESTGLVQSKVNATMQEKTVKVTLETRPAFVKE